MNELLEIRNLQVEYRTDEAVVHAVNGLDLYLRKGEAMGVVGETGAGKTTTALSVMGILPEKVGKVTFGEIKYKGTDILNASKKELQKIRGKSISMIFQDPMTSLNPIIRVGDQIREMLDLHAKGLSNDEKEKRVDEILQLVGIPAERKTEYPFQFSGGMKQRIGIAMALVCEPELLIADEPTTALDVTIQAQILALMNELKSKYDTSLLMITHDLGIVAETCDRVSVMYAGQVIESGTIEDVYSRIDNHPYTEGLFESIPRFDSNARRLNPIKGYMVDPTNLPKGCKFNARCPYAQDRCREEDPPVYENGTHCIKCFRQESWQKGGENDG